MWIEISAHFSLSGWFSTWSAALLDKHLMALHLKHLEVFNTTQASCNGLSWPPPRGYPSKHLASAAFLNYVGRFCNSFPVSFLILYPDILGEGAKFCFFLGLKPGHLEDVHFHKL